MPALGPDGDQLRFYKLCQSVPAGNNGIEDLLNNSLKARYDAIYVPLSETKQKHQVRQVGGEMQKECTNSLLTSCTNAYADEVVVNSQGFGGMGASQQLVFPFSPSVPSDLVLSASLWTTHMNGVCSSISSSAEDREYIEDRADDIDGDERDVYHALVKVVRREVDWGLHLGLHSILLPTPKLQVHPTGELELEPTY